MTSTTRDERLIATPGEQRDRDGSDGLEGGDPGAPRRGGPRLFTTFSVIVGVLALAAGGWYVSRALIEPGGQSTGELPLLVADTTPVKARPEDPGGAEIPNRDKYVYKSLDGDTAEQPVEQLLPAPEEPMAKPVDNGPLLEPLANTSLETMWARPAPEAPPAAEALPAVEQPSSIERETLSPPEQTAPEGGASEPRAPKADAPPKQSEAPVAASGQAPKEASLSPAAGGFWLQIAALGDEGAVGTEWKRLTKRFPAVLGKRERRVERVDLGAKGIWFRVHAGPWADRRGAAAACRSMVEQGGACKVIGP